MKLSQEQLHGIIIFFSLSAVFGSLYYQLYGDPVSNLQAGNLFPQNNGYFPCLLCWWQRVIMYPIALIALTALFVKEKSFSLYTAVLSAIGVPIALYHYFIQKVAIEGTSACSASNPCSASEVNYLGFITIPLLALIAFIFIFIASVLYYRQSKVTHHK